MEAFRRGFVVFAQESQGGMGWRDAGTGRDGMERTVRGGQHGEEVRKKCTTELSGS
ncbi:hypothetical protein D3C75_757650 [compost metagenome]